MSDIILPELQVSPPEQYGEQMLDPLSGLWIPKSLEANLRWRKRLLVAAESSDTTRRQLIAASSKSPLFWMNAFAFTYRPKKVAADGKEVALTDAATNVPFVTWKVQDEAILLLKEAIETGFDALINKSRDMGASWIGVAVFQWFFQFRGNVTFLELSRKESLVDKRGSMDSLFEKHRYLMKWQPNWLVPDVRDTYMHLENRNNGSVIDGESTNENAGQASRSTAILLDEFARIANGEAIDLATADTTACRIFNSTPGAPNAQFTKIYRQKRARIVELPWWRHPEKGNKARQEINPANGKIIWTSPWRENQKLRRSARDLAQNIDMEHGRVGDMVFDADEVNKHRELFGRAPDQVGTLKFNDDVADSVKKGLVRKLQRLPKDPQQRQAHVGLINAAVRFSTQGATLPLRLWVDLIDGRPPQDDLYVLGVDISSGTGSSNSVISVKSHKTGQIVAKFWDAYTTPEALAEYVAFLSIWFGGRKSPYVVFEKNGPGMLFGRRLLDLSYSNVYYQKTDGTKDENETKRWGWHSNPQRKEAIIGSYRDALKTGAVINPCEEALDEALDYIYDDRGRVQPGTTNKEEGGANATHGDHVVADALTVLGSADLPANIDTDPTRVPFGSFADRRRKAKAAKQRGEKAAWNG